MRCISPSLGHVGVCQHVSHIPASTAKQTMSYLTFLGTLIGWVQLPRGDIRTALQPLNDPNAEILTTGLRTGQYREGTLSACTHPDGEKGEKRKTLLSGLQIKRQFQTLFRLSASLPTPSVICRLRLVHPISPRWVAMMMYFPLSQTNTAVRPSRARRFAAAAWQAMTTGAIFPSLTASAGPPAAYQQSCHMGVHSCTIHFRVP